MTINNTILCGVETSETAIRKFIKEVYNFTMIKASTLTGNYAREYWIFQGQQARPEYRVIYTGGVYKLVKIIEEKTLPQVQS